MAELAPGYYGQFNTNSFDRVHGEGGDFFLKWRKPGNFRNSNGFRWQWGGRRRTAFCFCVENLEFDRWERGFFRVSAGWDSSC